MDVTDSCIRQSLNKKYIRVQMSNLNSENFMNKIVQAIRSRWVISSGVILIAGLILNDLLDNRPFRFEDFSVSKQLREALREKFPIGSNSEEALEALQKSGAMCEAIVWNAELPNYIKEYEQAYQCEYSPSWFSLHCLTTYRMWIISSKNGRLAYIGAERTIGWII
jgi:hypothetical protein